MAAPHGSEAPMIYPGDRLPHPFGGPFPVSHGDPYATLEEDRRCNFCGEPIPEDDVPLLAWSESDPDWMLRAHFACAAKGLAFVRAEK